MKNQLVLTLSVLFVFGCGGPEEPVTKTELPDTDAALVTSLADQYYSMALDATPEIAYFAGVELERHDGMEDNAAESRLAMEKSIDKLFAALSDIDADALVGRSEWITHAYLYQQLRASIAQRICRTDLWNVNQMGGWHSGYAQIASLQPVGTPALREQSLARWSKLAGYIDQEIEHLKTGLQHKYSAPKTVVSRVIDQVDGLLVLDIEKSPFYSPAARDSDEAFAEATYKIVDEQINPALKRYRDYLASTYHDAARTELSVTANPDGLACYEASLQAYTTLDRTGKEVYDLGSKTVANNKAEVIAMGGALYGLDDLREIVDRAKSDSADKFRSADELLQFSRDAVKRAEVEMPRWVGRMPEQPVEVVPFEAHEEGTGRSAHYNPAGADRPGEYRIPLHKPEEQSRGNAEVTAYHETWPGHHLQVAVGQSVEGLHPVTRIIWFSGPGEGWARYSEALAEEMGLYHTKSAPILRRAWPARGMVVDPGIHLFGWTREQAIEFMVESGRFPDSSGDELVDRIAILPGQLTAYDSGGLEIMALRKLAEDAMGGDFDIREFHDRVLENGVVPLAQLRTHIESWIASYEAQ